MHRKPSSRPVLAKLEQRVALVKIGVGNGHASLCVSRIRGRRLMEIRERWFSEHPLCVRCEAAGRVRLAEHLDHIVALTNGGDDFDRDNGQNRQGLCIPCHDAKTDEDLRGGRA